MCEKYFLKLQKLIDSIRLFFPAGIAVKNPNSVTGRKVLDRRVLDSALENATLWLDLLEVNPNWYEASCKLVLAALEAKSFHMEAHELSGKLYNKTKENAPSFVKWHYAHSYLLQKNNFEDALPLFESILGTDLDSDNPNQFSENYNILGLCYLKSTQFVKYKSRNPSVNFQLGIDDRIKLKKAESILKQVFVLDNDPPPHIHQNLIQLQIALEQYEDALYYINVLKNQSEEKIKKFGQHSINFKTLNKNYMLALQLGGNTEEVRKVMQKTNEKILKKNTKIASLIRLAQAEHQEEKIKAQRIKQEREKLLERKALNLSKTSSVEKENISEENFTYTEKNQKYKPQETKEKIKTRKAGPQQQKEIISQPEPRKSLIHIEAITQNSGAQKTFKKLFDKYDDNIKSDGNVKISFTEIDCFFEALDQKFEKSNGTSHQKVSLNFQDFGSDMEEQMVILTSKTYLKPEQIKDLRLAFIKARMVPNDPDLIKQLEEEGLL